MLVAVEGDSNAILSHKGQLTKCSLEHIRKATSLEQISAGAWEEAIREIIESAPVDQEVLVPAPSGDNVIGEEDDDELRKLFAEETPQPPPPVQPLES